jgi:glucokinase
MNILAGDIGGTKTLMQIASLTNDEYEVICEKSYVSNDHEKFSDVVGLFLDEYPTNSNKIDAACFGVAGPVTSQRNNQTATVTNLPWKLDTEQLKNLAHHSHVYLINDFQAVGYGIDTLDADDFVTLQPGARATQAPRMVLGAGTGLGVAQLIWQRNHYEVLATEGGHIDFAPTTAQQIELLNFLLERFDHVSYERLLSGPGLVNIYEYLRHAGFATEHETLRQLIKQSDPAAAIAEYAINENDDLASEAMDLFIAIYGAMAGNLALINLAFGGVYVAGGIAPKIINRLNGGGFVRAFNHKGRMSKLLSDVPVHVIMNPHVGLRGAARAGYYLAAASA